MLEKYFISTIPEIKEEMLYADFWINHSGTSSRIIGCTEKIIDFNNKNIDKNYLNDLFKLKGHYSKSEIEDSINSVSKGLSENIYTNGNKITEEEINIIEENLNLKNIAYNNSIYYGMVTFRTLIKLYPTDLKFFKSSCEYSLDRSVESAINICEPVIVLHESLDKQWFFIIGCNSSGWVKRSYIAVGSRNEVEQYVKSKNFLVVTGRRIYTNYNPIEKRTSLIPIDMGVRLKLVNDDEAPKEIDDMDVLSGYVVKFPVRNENGKLQFVDAIIPRCEDVTIGLLYYTEENIIKQSFKCLGERYGWGGTFFARDCSSYVLDVLRTMGLYIPRNTSEQDNDDIGMVKRMDNLQLYQKKIFLDQLPPGSLLYMKGHVMIYLGKYENEYYIIHDTIGFYISRVCKTKQGDLKYIKANGVTLTPMCIAYTSSGENYINALTAAKVFI